MFGQTRKPEVVAAQKDLVRRAVAGEPEAVEELYRLHAPQIFRYFFLRVQDHHLAEDLTAEVFMRVVRALPTYTDRGFPLEAWLFRIAHARWVDHHRKRRWPEDELLEAMPDEDRPSLEEEADTLRDLAQLRAQLAQLTDEQQAVIQLRFLEGYSLEQTAQVLNKTVGAVKAMQHRALQRLSDLWPTHSPPTF